jgi:hypothetical protein
MIVMLRTWGRSSLTWTVQLVPQSFFPEEKKYVYSTVTGIQIYMYEHEIYISKNRISGIYKRTPAHTA